MISDFIKNHKLTFTGIVLIIVGLLVYSSYLVVSRTGKEPVNIHLIPSDTKLIINGTQLGEGTSYIKPGAYKLEATRSGFETFQNTVNVGSPNTTDIDIALLAVSDSAKKWQQDNSDLYLAREGRGGRRANDRGIAFAEKNPITTKLPIENLLYTIGYRINPSDSSGNSIIITADASSGYRNSAIEEIRKLGYDPTDYTIAFNNYESPFSHE